MISELNTIQGSTASRYLSSSQSFLCMLQRVTSETSPASRLHAPYKLAATLDTEPRAKSYSGGGPTRVSSKHFQSALAWDCSPSPITFAQLATLLLLADRENTHAIMAPVPIAPKMIPKHQRSVNVSIVDLLGSLGSKTTGTLSPIRIRAQFV